MLELLIDSEGRPIGYELFPGNTLDSKTLEKSMEKLKQRFFIGQVIIVADRGLNNKLNQKHIKDQGYDYIVATRLKKTPENILAEVFNTDGYIKMFGSLSTEQDRKFQTDFATRFLIELTGSKMTMVVIKN